MLSYSSIKGKKTNNIYCLASPTSASFLLPRCSSAHVSIPKSHSITHLPQLTPASLHVTVHAKLRVNTLSPLLSSFFPFGLHVAQLSPGFVVSSLTRFKLSVHCLNLYDPCQTSLFPNLYRREETRHTILGKMVKTTKMTSSFNTIVQNREILIDQPVEKLQNIHTTYRKNGKIILSGPN